MTDLNKMTEEQIYKYWVQNNIFEKSIEAHKSKPEYVFYDGPPFMSSPKLHHGHILAGFIKDSVLRFHHNKGMNVPRYNGSDCHGLPIEFEIEKELGIKTTQEVLDYGIGRYNDACESIVLRYADKWEEQMGRLGRWVDFKNQYKTMDLSFMNSVWWVFSELYKKNRVYEGVRIMGYSTSCGTPLSNFEIQQNYQEVQDDSLFIKLPIKIPLIDNPDTSEEFSKYSKFTNTMVLVWTTTPWTLPSNYALCVGSQIDYLIVELEGSKYICGEKLVENIFGKKVPIIVEKIKGSELVGLEYIPPFEFNNLIERFVVVSGDFVTDSDGTGIVHLAPAYGADDYEVCLKNGIIQKDSKLFQPLDTNGFVDSTIPELKGMFYKNFKDKSTQDLNTWVTIELKKKSFYMEKRSFKHSYPFCWRSDTPLIYRAVNSWFIKVEDMRDRLTELNKQINWVPKSVGESRFHNWLAGAKDWGISRNRFWGTPIPIWKSPSGKIICVGSSYELERLAGLEPGSITNLHRQHIDSIEIHVDGEVYTRVDTVFDCWLESGSMPYGTVGRVGIVELLEKHCTKPDSGLFFDSESNPYIQTDQTIHDDTQSHPIRQRYKILPADFIAEGIDQTRGWFYTLLILSASLFDMIPFKNVIVNGLVLAEDGKKMSKRLKNYPDPMEIVDEYGSDALRLYLLSSQAARAEQLRFSKSGVHDMKKDIIIPLTNSIVFWKEYMELYWNTWKSNPIFPVKMYLNKITNPINLWVIRKYGDLSNEFAKHMEEYDLKNAIGILFKLVQVLNNGFIKMGRNLLKGKESKEEWEQSLSVMNYLIGFILNDLKSVIPFFCESQYLGLKDWFVSKLGITDCFDKSVHLVEKQNYLELSPEQIAKSIDFDIIYNIITQIYQIRSLNDISLKKPIKSVGLIWDEQLESRYSGRFKEYLNMVAEECNLLDIEILTKDQVSITKTINPVKGLFFKAYGREISDTWEKISKMDLHGLEEVIKTGEYDGYQIESTWFNQNYTVRLDELNNNFDVKQTDLVCKEFDFGKFNDKIIVLMDKSWSESNERIYYYRLVATSIQKSRKNAGLHPWDPIVSLWDGNPKYQLDTDEALEYIEKITRIKLFNYSDKFTKEQESTLIYSNDFENIGIKIHLTK